MSTPHLDLAIGSFGALCVILAATAGVGRLAVALRQPRVVGEMVAGVLLGPTLLGAVAPGVQAAIFPDDVRSVLYFLASLGLTIYMFLVGTGLESDSLRWSEVRRSSALAAAGIVPSFLLGAAIAAVYYERLAAPGTDGLLFSLFLGAALSITAFPMLARILDEEGLSRTSMGSLTLVAAAVDDAFAWVMLALVTALATAQGWAGALPTMAGGAVFAFGMLTLGRRALVPLGHRVERRGHLDTDDLAVVLLVVLASAWFTDKIGIFSVFGGFVAGLAMPRSPVLRRELSTRLGLVVILFLPVFFAFSGLNTRVTGLASAELLLPFLAVLVAACAGKYLGCAGTVWALGFSRRQASAIGGLMNARGLMILVFITIGSAYGILDQGLYTMLVLVAVITTAAAAPIYRISMRRGAVHPDDPLPSDVPSPAVQAEVPG